MKVLASLHSTGLGSSARDGKADFGTLIVERRQLRPLSRTLHSGCPLIHPTIVRPALPRVVDTPPIYASCHLSTTALLTYCTLSRSLSGAYKAYKAQMTAQNTPRRPIATASSSLPWARQVDCDERIRITPSLKTNRLTTALLWRSWTTTGQELGPARILSPHSSSGIKDRTGTGSTTDYRVQSMSFQTSISKQGKAGQATWGLCSKPVQSTIWFQSPGCYVSHYIQMSTTTVVIVRLPSTMEELRRLRR